MNDRQLTITISGPTGAGKSTLAVMIGGYLYHTYGIDVDIHNEEESSRWYISDLEARLEYFSNNVDLVTITTQTTAREVVDVPTSPLDETCRRVRAEVKADVLESFQTLRENLAKTMFHGGYPLMWSSDVCGELTCGYGRCSEYGEWELSLSPEWVYEQWGGNSPR
jgi:ABC-type lipoprotein export system ATPase subunit